MHSHSVLNPTWNAVFESILPDSDSRAAKWIRGILIPYIEAHLDEFCHTIYVDKLSPAVGEAAWHGDRILRLEGSVCNDKNQLGFYLHSDPWIVSFDLMHDNREIIVQSGGWLAGAEGRNLLNAPLRTETRIMCAIRDWDNSLNARIGDSLPFVKLFAAHWRLNDLRDWLTRGARKIPLTVTKLPYKEAVRLCDVWHEELAKQKEREAKKTLKNTPLGKREYLGRLVIAPGFSIPAGRTYDVYLLRDEQAFFYESLLMHHCVNGYWPAARDGKIAVVHLCNPEDEKDRWTCELGPVWPSSTNAHLKKDIQVRQFRGIANCSPHPELSTGFGNLFTLADHKSCLFVESNLDFAAVEAQFNIPIAGKDK